MYTLNQIRDVHISVIKENLHKEVAVKSESYLVVGQDCKRGVPWKLPPKLDYYDDDVQ